MNVLDEARALVGGSLRHGPGRFHLREVIVKEGITPWGKFQKALIEIHSRLDAARALEKDKNAVPGGLPRLEDEIRVLLDEADRHLKAVRAELGVGAGVILTAAQMEYLDHDHYRAVVLRRALVEKIALGVTTPETMENILALPDARPIVAHLWQVGPEFCLSVLTRPVSQSFLEAFFQGFPRLLEEAVAKPC